MSIDRARRTTLLAALAAPFAASLATLLPAALLPRAARAANATVQAVGVKFEPMTVYVEPGEQVSWEGMVGHNVETLGAMMPEGGTAVKSELGEDVTATFEVPGIYVYKCTPHWGTRMGGVIVVGKPEDPATTFDAYMAAIEENRGELLPAKGLLKKAQKDMADKGMV